MEVTYPHCAGLDVHKRSVVACRIFPGDRGPLVRETRTFGTFSSDVLLLAEWLAEVGVTHVAMESTGSYWKPIYNLLEGIFELLVVNAQHFRNVPGRKTDVNDAEWLANLLRHGLLKASFIPPREQRELRELTRYRISLVRERTAEINRIQKVLEGGNIKLASVVSDITGKSSMEMLTALILGDEDPKTMADRAKGRMRSKLVELEEALTGGFQKHQRFMLRQQLTHLRNLDSLISDLDLEIATRLQEHEAILGRLDGIAGWGRRTAEVVLAEVGTDMGRFPTAAHLASWSALCPGNNESAGKKKSGKTRQGNPWLRSTLVEAAHAVKRQKNTYAGTLFRRMAARRGVKKAAVAVAHMQLVAAYHIIKNDVEYLELGPQYFDERDRQGVVRRSVKRIEELGYSVMVKPLQQAA